MLFIYYIDFTILLVILRPLNGNLFFTVGDTDYDYGVTVYYTFLFQMEISVFHENLCNNK